MRPPLSGSPVEQSSTLTKNDPEGLEDDLIAHPGCTSASPGELMKHAAARVDVSTDQSNQTVWGGGLDVGIFLFSYSPGDVHGIHDEKPWTKASVDGKAGGICQKPWYVVS